MALINKEYWDNTAEPQLMDMLEGYGVQELEIARKFYADIVIWAKKHYDSTINLPTFFGNVIDKSDIDNLAVNSLLDELGELIYTAIDKLILKLTTP